MLRPQATPIENGNGSGLGTSVFVASCTSLLEAYNYNNMTDNPSSLLYHPSLAGQTLHKRRKGLVNFASPVCVAESAVGKRYKVLSVIIILR